MKLDCGMINQKKPENCSFFLVTPQITSVCEANNHKCRELAKFNVLSDVSA